MPFSIASIKVCGARSRSTARFKAALSRPSSLSFADRDPREYGSASINQWALRRPFTFDFFTVLAVRDVNFILNISCYYLFINRSRRFIPITAGLVFLEHYTIFAGPRIGLQKKNEKVCKEYSPRPTNGCKQLFFKHTETDDERDHTGNIRS